MPLLPSLVDGGSSVLSAAAASMGGGGVWRRSVAAAAAGNSGGSRDGGGVVASVVAAAARHVAAREWAVEAAGLISVQLVCFWLPVLLETIFATRADPKRAERARLQRGTAPTREQRRHVLLVVLRNTLATEVLDFATLALGGWRARTRVSGVSEGVRA